MNKEEVARAAGLSAQDVRHAVARGAPAPKKKDSAEVFVNGEFVAVLFREEEDGEISYQFQMAILDIDLEQA